MTMTVSEKDIQDGKKIMSLFESLTEEDKNLCLVYISALRDKQLISESKINAGS